MRKIDRTIRQPLVLLKTKRFATCVLVMVGMHGAIVAAAVDLPGEAAVRATAEEFTKAFNSGDAKAVAALWTADGRIVDESGAEFVGRDAIEGQYAALFKSQPNLKIKVVISSIELPTPNVAIEDGSTNLVTADGQATSSSRYRAVHILGDGKWRMTSVREMPAGAVGNSVQLSALGWLVGKWQAKTELATGESDVRWIANQAYLQRDYVNRSGDKVISSGTQIIGWDPESQQLRSWSFDSSGGHGIGTWTAVPEGFRIDSTGMLSDGTPTSSVDLLVRVPDADRLLGWRSTNRKAGQAQLPDTPEIVLERVAETK